MHYLGHLNRRDFLHPFLKHEILPRMGLSGGEPHFSVFRLNASNHVYLYEERSSGARLVGKFCHLPDIRPYEASRRRMDREFESLCHLRWLGFEGYPHYVARPLGRNADLNCLLVLEHCQGRPLSSFLRQAVIHRNEGPLFEKLSALAHFLSRLHNRTANGRGVDFGKEHEYFQRLAQQAVAGLGRDREKQRLLDLARQWEHASCSWEDQQVLVHGDATPANFLFGDGPWVIVLDLERMKLSDRVFDVGRIAAEIKHYFMQYGKNPGRAEPFIGHFLWEYACHFPDRNAAFASVCRRVPFYMGMTLLRISRNSWLSQGYRNWLLKEAAATLAAGAAN